MSVGYVMERDGKNWQLGWKSLVIKFVEGKLFGNRSPSVRLISISKGNGYMKEVKHLGIWLGEINCSRMLYDLEGKLKVWKVVSDRFYERIEVLVALQLKQFTQVWYLYV